MTGRRLMRLISTPLTLVILLGLLAAGAVWGYKAVTAAIPTTPPPPCATQTMKDLAPTAVTVRVYNAGTKQGLAGKIGQTLAAAGFVVETVSNSSTLVADTLIVGAAADDPEVQLVATYFASPQIQADGRPDHTVDIIVGDAYSGAGASPSPSIALASGTVCLPAPTPTPTPTPGAQPSDQHT